MAAERDDDNGFAEAGQARERGLVGELLAFMKESNSWWMLPLLIVFGILGVLLVLAATGVAPFIYPIFG